MSARPKDDPHYYLTLAIRSARILGVFGIVIGVIFIAVLGFFNRVERFRPLYIAFGLAVLVLPGVLYLACIPHLRRHRLAALIVTLVIAAIQTLCAAAALIASCTLSPVSAIPIVLSALWLAAMIQLLFHLSRGFIAMRLDALAEQRGFEPVMGQAVRPITSEEGERSVDGHQTGGGRDE